ncbi:unnamed protein product [Cladocopium goreaui]|uniref:Non-specific serine/threonine protein kinase n=1 Tax=Cladocopium goreaui TaxID=2562237 RepID=A0A9P1BWH2_9DINO|nr:unnamed protein product [Cladocopium goreaui]
MGGLALVKSGDEVLRRLGITNDFEASTDWLLRLSALHLFIAAVALAAQPQAVIMEVASKLPIERAERIAKVFERVDENHDGGISLEELQRLFVSMGLKDKALHAKAFETLDINGDGVLSFSEFAAGVLTVFSDLLEERFLELFRRHDLDSDGRLSRSELEVFLEKVLPLANRSVQQSPDPVIDSLVGNHDLVTFEELKDKLLPKRQARRK